MPFERSADGLIKHLVHHKMNTRERCVEAYMQFLKPGERSGKHRHMWEEVLFVVEGEGYDLHWDLKFDCLDAFEWEWTPEPRKFEWQRGDFIYVPPFTIHQHFNRRRDVGGAADRDLATASSRRWASTGSTRSRTRRGFETQRPWRAMIRIGLFANPGPEISISMQIARGPVGCVHAG